MTAVCYDGELLAADRMSRVKGADGIKKIKSLEKNKISTDFEGVVFDGERVHAVGRSGRVGVSRILIKKLRRSKDLANNLNAISSAVRKKFTPEDLNDAKPALKRIAEALKANVSNEQLDALSPSLDKVRDAVFGRLSTDAEKPVASMLVLTTNHTHVIRIFSDYRVEWDKHDRSKKVAIGSGKVVALFLMEHLGMNAADAVASMELHEERCGGGVTFTSRQLTTFEVPLQVIPHNNRESLSQNLLQASISAASRKLLNSPAQDSSHLRV